MKHIPNWDLALDGKSISRDLVFKDFRGAIVFVNQVAEIAEKEGHHPDMTVKWNKVRLECSTHAIGGLSTNDFILATKVDAIQ